tara:strand:+ start:160 stop:831 length:672 start_codon:yes stop_codon:yes gene_type:complete
MSTNIEEIKQITPGDNSWINGDLVCQIHVSGSTETKFGWFNWGTLEDSSGSMPFSGGGSDLSGLNRKTVVISGKGNKAKWHSEKDAEGNYVNTEEVSFGIGKNGIVEVDELGTPVANQVSPEASKPSQGHVNASQGGAIFGATVGMGINNAALDFRALGDSTKDWTQDQLKAFIWERASTYVRISQHMEAGNLAPKDEFEGAEPPEPTPEVEANAKTEVAVGF